MLRIQENKNSGVSSEIIDVEYQKLLEDMNDMIAAPTPDIIDRLQENTSQSFWDTKAGRKAIAGLSLVAGCGIFCFENFQPDGSRVALLRAMERDSPTLSVFYS